jgi:hypothetical protein
LFFRVLTTGNLASAEIKSGAALEPGSPKPVAQLRMLNSLYDVTADGQRFIVTVPTDLSSENDSAPLTVIFNWAARLKK